MPTAELLDALIAVETFGASVVLSDGRPKIRGNAEAVPESVRVVLRRHSVELVDYLEKCQRPPTFVLFASSRLGLVEVASVAVEGVAVLWRGEVPFYRVDPSVAMWLTESASALKKSGKVEASAMREVEATIASIWEWVLDWFPRHKVKAAMDRRGHSKPSTPKPPRRFADSDDWNQKPLGAK